MKTFLGWLGVLLLASGVIAIIVILSIWAESGPSTYERFELACEDRGGFLAETGDGFWSNIKCVKDNQVIYLPGFA